MDIRNHFESFRSQVIGCKVKMDDVIRRVDKMPSGDRERVAPFFYELHKAVEELTVRVEKFNSEYAARKATDKSETGGKFVKFKKIWKEIWKHDLPCMRYPHL